MKSLRTAVVGLGRIGWQYHVPSIVKHEGFALTAVVDPSPERLREAETEYAVKGYADYHDMLQKEKLDLVVIASPTLFHVEQTIAAFIHGIDVFIEKPMAASLAEADSMIAAMQKHGRKLMVYQPRRLSAELLIAKQIIDSEIIGPVYMIKRAYSSYHRRNDWQAFKKYGGGMLNNYGSHFIDQLLYLAGAKAKNVTCHTGVIATLGDAEDVVKALIEAENGIILDLDINLAISLPLPEWVVLGQRGTAILEKAKDKRMFYRVRYYLPEDLQELPVHTELAAPGRTYANADVIPWRTEEIPVTGVKGIDYYDKCYEYYALDRPPFVPIEQTREVIRVIDRCRKSE